MATGLEESDDTLRLFLIDLSRAGGYRLFEHDVDRRIVWPYSIIRSLTKPSETLKRGGRLLRRHRSIISALCPGRGSLPGGARQHFPRQPRGFYGDVGGESGGASLSCCYRLAKISRAPAVTGGKLCDRCEGSKILRLVRGVRYACGVRIRGPYPCQEPRKSRQSFGGGLVLLSRRSRAWAPLRRPERRLVARRRFGLLPKSRRRG